MRHRDEFGRVGLHYAARDGDLTLITQLLQAGEDVDVRDGEGWTPLHFAAQEADPAAIALLLDAGADVDAVTANGMPAIYWAATAASGDPIASIRVLRAAGADPTAETIQSYFGSRSALHYIRDFTNRPEIAAEFADLA
ncbi:ankyrin repeat domain-containing protein [Nocardia farcinica]|uniref:Uncharacterized protein n=1 Tax=Nocardia farcinica (strain IFM 10152) TaxID=247156 RepID=Q5YPM9_NOCFA|nr:ankyrin repeat domain-containing protein [Nocardia farcinica]BAD59862.1 hypothetical protein NFA_50100 [Nocardia farcinica IFM 10152]